MEILKSINPKFLNAQEIAHELSIRSIVSTGKITADREKLAETFGSETTAPLNAPSNCDFNEEVTICRESLINIQQIYNSEGGSAAIQSRLEHLRQRVNRIEPDKVTDQDELTNLYIIVFKFMIDVASDRNDTKLMDYLIQEVSKKSLNLENVSTGNPTIPPVSQTFTSDQTHLEDPSQAGACVTTSIHGGNNMTSHKKTQSPYQITFTETEVISSAQALQSYIETMHITSSNTRTDINDLMNQETPKALRTGTIKRITNPVYAPRGQTQTICTAQEPIFITSVNNPHQSHVAPSFTLDTTDFRRYLNEDTPRTGRGIQTKFLPGNGNPDMVSTVKGPMTRQVTNGQNTYRATQNSCSNCSNCGQNSRDYRQAPEMFWTMNQSNIIRDQNLVDLGNNYTQQNPHPSSSRRHPHFEENEHLTYTRTQGNDNRDPTATRILNRSRHNMSTEGNTSNGSAAENSIRIHRDLNPFYWSRKIQMVQKWSIRFSGKPGTISLLEFIFHVGLLASTHKIDQDDLVSLAVHLLEGQALFVYKSRMQTCQTWVELVSELKDAFVIGDFDESIRERIRNRYQAPGETFGLYCSEMSLLFDCLSDEISEAEKCQRLLKNADPRLSIALATAPDNHVSLADLIKKCYKLEKYFYDIQNRSNNHVLPQNFYSLPDPNQYHHNYSRNTIDSRNQPQLSVNLQYQKYWLNEIENRKFENNIENNLEEIVALKTQVQPSNVKCFRCNGNHHFLACDKKEHAEYKNIIFCYVCGKQGTISPRCCRANQTLYGPQNLYGNRQ